MKVVYKENPRTICIRSDTHSLCFEELNTNRSKHLLKESAVAVELLPNDQITKENGFKALLKKEVFGCLGLISIDKKAFLAVITGAMTDVAHPVDYESVDKIYSVDFVSLSSDEWDFVSFDTSGLPLASTADEFEAENSYAREPHPCHEMQKLLSNGSFYYSNDFDLTSLIQNRGIQSSRLHHEKEGVRKINLEHYLEEYMWNSFMMCEIFEFRSKLDSYVQSTLDDNRFLTTVIRGFAKTVNLNSSGESITIISKQSWKRAGTRFNARGIDDNGNVANFVETEFIFNQPTREQITSFTQIRGSVPTFWEQDLTLINPKITLTRSLEATQPIFNKHFTEICQKYGVCHIINLLSKTKPAEVQVLRRYKQLYNGSNRRDEMAFSEFDFHHETKQLSGGFAGATKILPMLYDSLENFGWFVYDSDQGETVTRQDGVFRTNCLDCLDRTNLIQQVICQSILEHTLQNQRGGNREGNHERYAVEDLVNKHNTLWADHGDAISQIYTGTNALKSSFSRSGKMNFAGALSDVTKSVSRMYQNTFLDSKKQSTMDLLLGYDAQNSLPVRIYDPINEFVQEKLHGEAGSFTTWNDINIFVGTFNVNAAVPHGKLDLASFLFPPENTEIELPDVYAIGLQEVIELNAGSILSSDSSKPSLWAKLLETQLNSQGEPYLLLRAESIASMSLFLFVKKSQVHKVTQVAGSSKKTGLGGIAANKGACGVRFEFGLTSFVLVTSHLAAGTTALVERYNDYMTIMSGLTFTRNFTIKDHDHIIWFGDLNYRVSLPNDQCRYFIENGAFDELTAVDQLNQEMTRKGAFYGFKEGAIKFYPTYKFDKGTSNYDSSEKQRIPSWTDRVLYMTSKGVDPIKQLNYNSCMNIVVSDHKPVYSTLKSRVKFVDEEKKIKLSKHLYDTYKKEHGDIGEVSLLELSDSITLSSKPSSLNSDSSFSMDTLSEMNLLDDADTDAPKLPARPMERTNTLPKRIPPPPMSRKQISLDQTKTASNAFPRKLPPTPYNQEVLLPSPSKSVSNPLLRSPTASTSASTPPPPPPPSRKVGNPVKPPIGFSSTPLISSRSNSATPSRGSPVSTPSTTGNAQNQEHPKLNPIVPTKPASLASSKTKPSSLEATSASASDIPNSTPATSARSTSSDGNGKLMSEWKPLMPS